jgi:hypothetical protein
MHPLHEEVANQCALVNVVSTRKSFSERPSSLTSEILLRTIPVIAEKLVGNFFESNTR